MFDLEARILEWRKQMLDAGIKSPEPLEELEIHLREEIEQRMWSGTLAPEAFEIAAGKFGQATILKNEFVKADGSMHEKWRRFIFNLTGIPNHQLATNMNINNASSEPRWATYAKAGTFLFPAIFLWFFTVVLVMPKAVEICQAAGMTLFNFSSAPAIIKALATSGPVMVFLTHHCVLIGGATILAFVLMERYFSQWPRYRRPAIGIGAFLLNTVLVLSLTMMIISVSLAAPSLVHHVK